MRATCSNCKLDFDFVVREQSDKKGNLITYAICPMCDHRYDIAKVTPRGQELSKELDRIRDETPNSEMFWKILNEYQREVTRP
jgi:hypothetical protein